MTKIIRQAIVEILKKEQLSTLELSGKLGIKEKEISEHLKHISRSIRAQKFLLVESARCKNCGFQFKKRERIKSPSRCPRCKSEFIERPRFSIA